MSRLVKVVAGVIIAVAVVILAYAVLTPEETTDTTDHMGNGPMIYSSSNVGLIAIALVLIVGALMVVVLWHDYEPLPPSMVPPPRLPEQPSETATKAPEPPPATPKEAASVISGDEQAGRNYLVLRLLTGDERTMFKAIMDSGGEALQKDLITRTKMSNAKVSRVLDRLILKDVVTKERHGATNKIRIKPEP